MIARYIHLNPITQTKVDQFYNQNMKDRRTIAIHIRGTDKFTEEKLVSPEVGVAEALKYADKDTQFFIVTDEQVIFDKMFTLLKGKRVIYYDCYRSENGKPLHYRKPSLSQLGEDVIIEMWLMAKCDMLIHTTSNVSTMPLFINPKLEHIILV